ncbi:hypothetical protein Tco_0858308 [Tanacetum coccineum]|uniref:Reverse transcriptase domain-containing protein n=1 Tax=Tanacetum coccineum TaxID=301880 RepID=A0ABQ5BCK6_9ASTR
MDREVKRLRQRCDPIIKVRWNSRRGPEFTWEHEDQFRKKYPHLFTNVAPSSTPTGERGSEGGGTEVLAAEVTMYEGDGMKLVRYYSSLWRTTRSDRTGHGDTFIAFYDEFSVLKKYLDDTKERLSFEMLICRNG